eukprot:TRINITY_DN6347_c0_g1_i1.p1 TRINITY_DN6347_c0_g1~~TRINITY_DN6347_c0_g1_i1.p1  ORF type:complete len:590 (+),score=66.32 TRINITY_DN6347_c0_g1_i1:901-2670(+)
MCLPSGNPKYEIQEQKLSSAILFQSTLKLVSAAVLTRLDPQGQTEERSVHELERLRKETTELKQKLDEERIHHTAQLRRLQQEIKKTRASSDCLLAPITPSTPWARGDVLGRGSHGTVYLAMNTATAELFAVKQIIVPEPEKRSLGDEEMIRSFREIAVLNQLRHPNIVRYLGSTMEGHMCNIFQEYIPGGSIKQLLGKFGAFRESITVHFLEHILQGLHYLHTKNVLHRDIKGDNILVTHTGVAKLADFGTAKVLREGDPILSEMAEAHGTPFWLAPEVLKGGEHQKESDVWSVGCVVIEMATAYPPWRKYRNLPRLQLIYKIASANEAPDIPGHLSPDAAEFVGQCLRVVPLERPGTAALLRHNLLQQRPQADLQFLANSPDTRTEVRIGSPPYVLDEEPTWLRFKASQSRDNFEDRFFERERTTDSADLEGTTPGVVKPRPNSVRRLRATAASIISSNSSNSRQSFTSHSIRLRRRKPSDAIRTVADSRDGDDASNGPVASDNSSIFEMSMTTLTIAVTWLSLIKEVSPIETYMQMALDYPADDDEDFEDDTAGSERDEGSESGHFPIPGSTQFSRPRRKTTGEVA